MFSFKPGLLSLPLLFLATAAVAEPAYLVAPTTLRQGPGRQYAPVVTLRAGSAVDVGDCDYNWCQVRVGRFLGYVRESVLEFADDQGAGYTAPPVYRPAPPVYRPAPPIYRPAPPVYSQPPVYRQAPPAYRPPPPVYRPPPQFVPPAAPRMAPPPPRVAPPPPPAPGAPPPRRGPPPPGSPQVGAGGVPGGK